MTVLSLAFLGDVYAAPGRRVVEDRIGTLRSDHTPDVVVANGENASHGLGISPKLYRALRAAGIDAVTLGDHVYRDRSIVPTLEEPNEPILRPANLSRQAPGKQCVTIPPAGRRTRPVHWITVLGRIFMNTPADDPFAAVDRIIAGLEEPNPIVFVEAHMEATSEKAALAHHLDGRVTAVLGTHTHVPTADECILPGGTAFQCDVGMTGPYESILGRRIDRVLETRLTANPTQFDVATGDVRLSGSIVDVDPETGLATGIERVMVRAADVA